MEPERWRQIENLYHAALELSGSGRAAFLAEACGADHDLRREVDSLLASDAAAGSFIEAPAMEVAAKALADNASVLATGKDSLKSGAKLSHYQILEKLGSGGMGEVYRARDTKLGRDVALKILPEQFAGDPERLARFQREARAVAALNHPNIVTLHSVEEAEGVHFLTMELVEGKSLDRLIPVGGLPLERIVEIASALAEALAAAHEKGIVHRDLKPANVMMTNDGRVKVLDFGLAMETHAANPTDATLMSARQTGVGAVMGTPAYMSPEQARGEELDARTDLFSFGAVLYEMATGRQAFSGTTAAVIHDAILNRAPVSPLSLNPSLPPKFEEIIHKALEKDRDVRYQHASDILADLKRLKRDTISVVGPGPFPRAGAPASRDSITRPPQGAALRWGWVAGGVAVVVALAIAYLFRPTLPPPQVLSSSQITNDGQPKYRMVTDGARLYFSFANMVNKLTQVSTAGGPTMRIDTPVESPYLLDISSDRSQLLVESGNPGSVSNYPIFTVPVLGGSPHRLDSLVVWDAAWSPDGRQLVYSQGDGLYLANADGMASRKLAPLEGFASSPRWSPDGKQIRFSIQASAGAARSIWEVSEEGKGLHQLLAGWNNPPDECCGAWTPDAKYFFFQSGKGGTQNIWAIREGGSAFYKVNHQPVQVTTGPAATLSPLPSLDGKKLFAITSRARGKLVRYNAKSREFVPYLNGISATDVDFSRDGQWIAFVQYPEGTLWRSKLEGSDKVQLTVSPMATGMPRWSPDGAQIAFFGITADQGLHAYIIGADGTGTPQAIPGVPGEAGEEDVGWSPDGKSLVFSGAPPGNTLKSNPNAIHIMDMGNRKVTTLPGSEGLFSPRWSPNGRYIAAVPNDSRGLVVYDLSAGKWSDLGVNFNIGYPQWSRDGQTIFFLGFPKGQPSAIFRVRLSDHRMEPVASLEHFHQAFGNFGSWMGIAPDNSPMLVEDVGTQDIYALELKLP